MGNLATMLILSDLIIWHFMCYSLIVSCTIVAKYPFSHVFSATVLGNGTGYLVLFQIFNITPRGGY